MDLQSQAKQTAGDIRKAVNDALSKVLGVERETFKASMADKIEAGLMVVFEAILKEPLEENEHLKAANAELVGLLKTFTDNPMIVAIANYNSRGLEFLRYKSLEVIAKAKGEPVSELVAPTPKPHNPRNLTPEQVGVSNGWRLLDEDEIQMSPRDCGVEHWNRRAEEWVARASGSFSNRTYRTKLTREELAKARAENGGRE